jgi:hypothetical protein
MSFCHAKQTSRQKVNPWQTPSHQTRPEECCSKKACPRQTQGPSPFEGNVEDLPCSKDAAPDKVENLAVEYLTELKEADVTFKKGTAVLKKYRVKYPELASYIREIAPGERRIPAKSRGIFRLH